MIISAGSFKQAANSVDKNSKKSRGTLDHWKLLTRCGFLQARSSRSNEKYADRQIVGVLRSPVTEGQIRATKKVEKLFKTEIYWHGQNN